MKKRSLGFLALLFAVSFPAAAQKTTVFATVVDPSGIPYSRGSISGALIVSGTPKVGQQLIPSTVGPVTLDISGHFAVSVYSNTSITPINSQWRFQVCASQSLYPQGAPCFTAAPITITGASQSISAQLNAAAAPLSNFPITAGAVTATGAPIAGDLPFFTGATSISGSVNATLDALGNAAVNNLTITGTCTGCPAGAVTSVFSRVGAVTAQSGDYGLGQIGNPAAATTFSYALNQGSNWVLQGASASFNITGAPLTLGTLNSALGTLKQFGSTSGTVIIQPQAIAGTPTITWGTSTGTPVVTASSPLAITAATGNITCSTCTTGSLAFSAITAGTNANALVMGTGGSLGTSGSGTITATAAPFSGITAATNANALVMGTGGSLDVSGTGTVRATTTPTGGLLFPGSGSGTATVKASATAGTPTVTWGTGTGTPAVTASSPLSINTTTGDISCSSCTTGSLAFSAITAGTNANALVMGTGGSLGTSGSGTITATAAPFSGITAATNVNALVMGTGGSLDVSGTGIVRATTTPTGGLLFPGSGSGTATVKASATAGTPTVTWGTGTGTPAVTASSPLAINTTTGDVSCATCSQAVAITNYPSNVGSDVKTAQTSAIGSTTLLTTGGANATYMAVATINCTTTSAAATVNVTVGWTDTGSQAQTQTLGSAVVCTSLGSASMGGFAFPFRAKTATTITYSTAIVNTPTYDVAVTIYQTTSN
jgi:fibronectin-binding autotransporter adhesin